ncbi:MAG: hypothetical protein AAF226_10720, partial [Verrucomicrobiota bacterium]
MTLELPADIASAASATAAKEGCSVDQWLVALIERHTADETGDASNSDPSWIRLGGAVCKAPDDKDEL